MQLEHSGHYAQVPVDHLIGWFQMMHCVPDGTEKADDFKRAFLEWCADHSVHGATAEIVDTIMAASGTTEVTGHGTVLFSEGCRLSDHARRAYRID
ncbi:MAG: hypothetical protein RLN70_03460 [Rhodospirillaceae bacterium]